MAGLARRVKDWLGPGWRWAYGGAERRLLASPHARGLAFDLLDGYDRLRGRGDPDVPPRRLVYGIGAGFEVGQAYLRYFRDLAGLRPDEAVLDVGCGVGRMALPLAGYLAPPGRYEGFDIIRANVAWCRRRITPRAPHFRFRHADVFSREYNPRGRLRGDSFAFPYPDAAFDFAFLTSVFTHLVPADAAHYLSELGRVLKPGGRCLATFFLLNPEAQGALDAGLGLRGLVPLDAVSRVADPANPEACIAFDEGFVRDAAGRAGLTMEPPRYGTWCGRFPAFEYQDVVILRKAG